MDDLGRPELPPTPEDPTPPQEPNFPGGGPTDTRQDAELEADLAEDARAEERREREEDERRERRESRGGDEGELQVDPPSLQEPEQGRLSTDRPPNMSDAEFEQWKKDHPTGGSFYNKPIVPS